MQPDPRPPLLVGEWLSLWFDQKVKRGRKQTTQERYQGIIEKQIIPHLGNTLLAELTPRQVDAMENALLDSGLSPRTVRNVHTVLSGACREAVRLEIIDRNPAASVAPPAKPSQKVVPPPVTVVRDLLQLTSDEGHYLHPFLRLLVYTGMRRGEALALRWRHVNLEERYLTVVESAVKTQRLGTVITAPKSANAFRSIDLDDGTIAILRAHRAAQSLNAQAPGDDVLVFQARGGGVMKPNNILRDLKRLGWRVGYPDLTFHSLRHFHASVTLQQHQNVTVVSRRLGHSNVATTLATYAHMMPGWQRATADAFAKAMEQPC